MDFRKVIGICLPVAASLSVLGVGFASWVFDVNDIKASNNASVYVVSDVTKGSITIAKSPTSVVFSSGYKGDEDLSDGIEFLRDNGTYKVEDDEVTLRYKLEDSNDSIEGNKFRLFISFSNENNDIDDYICLNSLYSSAGNDGYDFSKELVTYPTTSDEYPNGYFEYTLKLNKAIQYTGMNAKPLNENGYTSVCSALVNASITVKFVVI